MTYRPRLTPIRSSELPEEIDGIPYFHQRDERWFDEPYTICGNSEQTIGSSGCVPTTEAMLYAHFARDLGITPFEMAKWNLHQGFRTANHGTDSLRSLPKFAAEFGLELGPCSPSPEAVQKVLGSKGLVYAVLRGGAQNESLATSEAHAVLIREISDGELKAHTSESLEKSLRPWNPDEILLMADPKRVFGVYPPAS